MIEWADEIVCVEKEVSSIFLQDVLRFEDANGKSFKDVKFIVLDIPDIYDYMNPTLQRIIIEQYEGAINEN